MKKGLKLSDDAKPSSTLIVFLMGDHLLIVNERREWWKYDPAKETMLFLRAGDPVDVFTPAYQTETGYLGYVIRSETETAAQFQEYAYLSFEDFKNGEEPLVLSHNNKKPLNIELVS